MSAGSTSEPMIFSTKFDVSGLNILTTVIALFCCISVVKSIDNTILYDKGSLLPGHVWYVRQGHELTVNCTPVSTTRYQDARYMWRDHLGRGAARRQWQVYGNGTLRMRGLETTDTDTYHCAVSVPQNNDERYFHSVIVYLIANFYMEYPVFYTLSKCDYQLNNLKIQEVQEYLCQHYTTRCPFHSIFNCHRTSKLVAGVDGVFELVVLLQQHPDIDFEPPDCDVACVKQSIVKHLNGIGADVVNKLIVKENGSQLPIYGIISFDAKGLSGRRIQTQCPSGYELYEDVLCIPCFPGYYLEYGITNSDIRRPCKPCPDDYYQDRFGMDECYLCRGLSRSQNRLNETFSMSLCDVSIFHLPPVYIFLVSVIVTAAVIVTVVAICVICCSRRTRQKKMAKTPNQTVGYHSGLSS